MGKSGSCALTSMFRFWSFFSASYHLTLLAELNVLQRKARAAAFHDRRLKQKRERCLLSSACTHVREMQCNVGEFFFLQTRVLQPLKYVGRSSMCALYSTVNTQGRKNDRSSFRATKINSDFYEVPRKEIF